MSGVNYYADRGFVSINGREKANVKSIKWTVDESLARVDTMSRDRRSAGWKKGNRKVTGSMELEVLDSKAEIDLAFKYGQDVDVVCSLGTNGERWKLIGLEQSSQDLTGSVGDAGKSISFECVDAVNENGAAVNADIGL
jgi:hypothetical protein